MSKFTKFTLEEWLSLASFRWKATNTVEKTFALKKGIKIDILTFTIISCQLKANVGQICRWKLLS